LVDIRRKPIKEITPTGLRTADGDYALDVIVFATGFDAMTGAMKEIDIYTDAGMSVREKWEDGPCGWQGGTDGSNPVSSAKACRDTRAAPQKEPRRGGSCRGSGAGESRMGGAYPVAR
jgi:hypothetical protein